jgi:hypothetical protein
MEVKMESNYDFSDAIKNPFAGREKGKYTVTVHYDFTEESDLETEEQSVEIVPQPAKA